MNKFNLKPVFGILLGALIIFLLLRSCGGKKPVVETREVVVRDTIHHYPDAVPFPEPVTKYLTKTIKVNVEDTAAVAMLTRYYEERLKDCERNYNSIISGIKDVPKGSSEVKVEVKAEEMDTTIVGDGYVLDWKIGYMGDLLYFKPDITLTKKELVPPKKKNNHLGLMLGTDQSLDPHLGLNYRRGWLGGYVAVSKGKNIYIGLNPTISW